MERIIQTIKPLLCPDILIIALFQAVSLLLIVFGVTRYETRTRSRFRDRPGGKLILVAFAILSIILCAMLMRLLDV